MMNNYSINRQIVEQFLKLDFVYISKQKYSSNVIEKVGFVVNLVLRL